MATPAPVTIPTEPIGSIPRPVNLIERIAKGDSEDPRLDPLYEDAIRETIEQFEATGSPVVSDGEQRKYHNFCTYCVHGLPNTAPDGFQILFSDGHTRRLSRLTRGPFRYSRYADSYLDVAMRYAHVPLKQAVISPSALSLMYPAERIPDYSREQFIDDLLNEHETELRRCLKKGAHAVQVDFTEGRLAVKIDPSGHLLNSFIDLNNLALSRFSREERTRIGVHTCPGNDFDSTHSADVDYAELLPSLFELKAGNFYIAMAGERDRRHALKIIGKYRKLHQRVFVGVTAPVDPHIETPEEVRDRVLEACEYIPVEQLGTRSLANTENCISEFSWESLLPSTPILRPRKKCGTVYLKPVSTYRSSSSELPTTADSRLSAMTLPRAVTQRLPRSGRVCWARNSRRDLSEVTCDYEGRRKRAAAIGCPAECN